MLKILLTHKGLTQEELKARAELHVYKMDDNPVYSEFQPLITAFKPLVATYSVALINAKLGGADRIEAKNKAKDAVSNFIMKIIKTLELKADDLSPEAGEALVKGAGFEIPQVRGSNKAVTYLETPILTIENVKGRRGVINMNWERIEGAITYGLEELDSEGHWQNGKYCSQISLQLTDLEVGTKKTYRLKGIGAGTLVSGYSEPVTIWVN